MADNLRNAYLSGELKVNADLISMISEELALYLIGRRDGLRVFEILPYDEVLANGARHTANKRKYTHMWGDSKFNSKYIELVKLKIKKEFPESYSLVEKYEMDVLDKIAV